MLATPTGNFACKGADQGRVKIINDAYVAVGEDGNILSVGTGEVPENLLCAEKIVDAEGKLVTPGLVDAHTHLIFGGWREHELALKLRGVGYLEILAQGGGILSTVRKTREASVEELTEKGAKVLKTMLSQGTTTCEAKSGYGLDLETELKQLQAIARLNETQAIDLVPTFLGAHALPEEYKEDREGYIRLLCDEMIPRVAEEKLAEFCDVFCETGVFTAEETEQILNAGLRHGLPAKVHADEIDPIGGSVIAGKIGAVSAEHLICTPDEGIEAMAKSGTVAVLLPATSFYLDKTFARAKDMMAAGVPVAVATDFNPGSCPNSSLQTSMHLACYKYRMTPEEVLTAVTLNAAAAIRRADRVGSVEEGKMGDLVIWDAENLDYIFYRFGSNLVKTVIKKGVVC